MKVDKVTDMSASGILSFESFSWSTSNERGEFWVNVCNKLIAEGK